jgi:hypothetical protein
MLPVNLIKSHNHNVTDVETVLTQLVSSLTLFSGHAFISSTCDDV